MKSPFPPLVLFVLILGGFGLLLGLTPVAPAWFCFFIGALSGHRAIGPTRIRDDNEVFIIHLVGCLHGSCLCRAVCVELQDQQGALRLGRIDTCDLIRPGWMRAHSECDSWRTVKRQSSNPNKAMHSTPTLRRVAPAASVTSLYDGDGT